MGLIHQTTRRLAAAVAGLGLSGAVSGAEPGGRHAAEDALFKDFAAARADIAKDGTTFARSIEAVRDEVRKLEKSSIDLAAGLQQNRSKIGEALGQLVCAEFTSQVMQRAQTLAHEARQREYRPVGEPLSQEALETAIYAQALSHTAEAAGISNSELRDAMKEDLASISSNNPQAEGFLVAAMSTDSISDLHGALASNNINPGSTLTAGIGGSFTKIGIGAICNKIVQEINPEARCTILANLMVPLGEGSDVTPYHAGRYDVPLPVDPSKLSAPFSEYTYRSYINGAIDRAAEENAKHNWGSLEGDNGRGGIQDDGSIRGVDTLDDSFRDPNGPSVG